MSTANFVRRGSDGDTGFHPVVRFRIRLEAGVTFAALLWAGIAMAAPDYHADIAPLLRQYCAGCHNDEDFKGDFSVERFADLQEGGSKGTMLKGGDPAGSYLIRLMTGGVGDPMPPKDEPQPTADEIALFKNWIAGGAPGPEPDEDISILSMLTVPDFPKAPGAPAVTAMDAAQDGKQMALARFGSVEILEGEKLRLRIEELPGKVNSLHFSPDGRTLVTASGTTGLSGLATIWSVSDGKRVREFGRGYHRDVLYDAEFSPDGKLLATAGYDARIAIWDVESGEQLRTIEVHNGAVFDLAFSPDGSVLASASADDTVKLWKVANGQRLDTLNQPQGEQFAVAFSPDGEWIFAGGADNRVRMWRFVSTDKPRINPVRHSRFAHESAVVKLAVSPDGKWLVSTSDDLSVKLWALPELIQMKAWENQPDVVAAVAISGAHAFTAGRMDGSIQPYSFDEATLSNQGRIGAPDGTVAFDHRGVREIGKEPVTEIAETEGPKAQAISIPAEISGMVGAEGDADDFRFNAKAGEEWVVEVNAARSKSPLDSKIEILTAAGESIERVKLQAVRDSWFTFRGKDSKQATDFRVHNWREMELNEYLYCNGEVVRLWLYPRGPDSGYKVYPGFGNRLNYFGSSALTHALGEPCYVVKPIPAGLEPQPNGLPVFTMFYENDDDSLRQLGKDSKLFFTVPADGDYLARISDVRGFGGDDFKYRLAIRRPAQDFKVTISGIKDTAMIPGSGKEFVLEAERFDGFDGPITVDVTGLPPGFTASSPLVIEAGQFKAMGTVQVDPKAPAPVPANAKLSKLTATATVFEPTARGLWRKGRENTHEIGSFGELKIDPAPSKLFLEIHPDGESGQPKREPGKPLELTIRPGETITAIVRAKRIEFPGQIDFGKEDSARNLAHGLIIDNIGLNGLMIREGENERQFFITASKWVPESTRTLHLKTGAAGGHATPPVILQVKPRKN